MQSAIWKILTAAGVIGIGTFVVLEVQNRVAESRKWRENGSQSVAGVETTVTPNAESDFDRLVESGLHEPPEDFDKPGTGIGTPAPPADDEKFAGVIDQRVKKEDLSDASPFAMEEPLFSSPNTHEPTLTATEGEGDEASSKTALASATEDVSKTGVEPAKFDGKPDGLSAKTEPSTISEKTGTGAAAANGKASPAGVPKPRATNKIDFFGSGSGKEDNAKTVEKQITQVKAEINSQSDSAAESSGASKRNPATVTPAVATALKAQPDEVELAFPSPVPDVTQPAPAGSGAEEAPFERSPFESDGGKPNEATATPSTLPAKKDDRGFSQFDNEKNVTPSNANTGSLREPRRDSTITPAAGADDPFSEDADDRDVPLPVRDPSTLERDRSNASPFPDSAGAEPSPFDQESPLGSPTTRPDRDRTLPESGRGTNPLPASEVPSDEPFEMDESNENVQPVEDGSFGGGFDPKPLPSADEMPPIIDRKRPRGDAGRIDDRSASESRTEVLRPQLTIQKLAPNTATVGITHKYTIVVANDGQEAANDVIVEDHLGSEATLIDSRPVAEYDRSAEKLLWKIARLEANEKREIVVTIKPTGEGTLDGVATVGYKAQVKSETVITAPQVELEVTGPVDAKVGGEVPLQFIIRNRGSSDASNVILRSVLPPALQHPEGADLEYEIATLRAGDQEIVDLAVVAAEPGDRVLVSAEITSNGASLAKGRTEIEVVGAQLQLERRGPERRFVGRSALYQNVVTNDSRFEALNATVVEEIPETSRFVSASNGGSYDAQTRRVKWSIPRLPAGKQLALEIELVTDEAGEVESVVEVVEDAGFRTPLTQNTKVTVEDLHNVTADISRQDEPVAVGEQFGFTVTIENRGTAVARNVLMTVQVPLEIRVLAAGTKQVKGNLFANNLVKYDTVPEIQPNEKVTFQIKLQGQRPIRNAPVKASLTYDEMTEPLVVSESVTVFDDRP